MPATPEAEEGADSDDDVANSLEAQVRRAMSDGASLHLPEIDRPEAAAADGVLVAAAAAPSTTAIDLGFDLDLNLDTPPEGGAGADGADMWSEELD